ncbi:hypothetical protein EYF80_002600 [Liparis tanakae]|uniref:Uncharacterized protein n=1 Tax=Liparis tanakae TaxID=230148 RepID=A0A4Z2JB18_9TELE|nr:hypothetical protein EYF80_002600 [Liparis tanakae]
MVAKRTNQFDSDLPCFRLPRKFTEYVHYVTHQGNSIPMYESLQFSVRLLSLSKVALSEVS